LESVDHFDGVTEVARFDGHDHVDGIEVFPATEAPGQIGLWIGGCVELRAQRTQKAEVSL
jgi:hypothetical protein